MKNFEEKMEKLERDEAFGKEAMSACESARIRLSIIMTILTIIAFPIYLLDVLGTNIYLAYILKNYKMSEDILPIGIIGSVVFHILTLVEGKRICRKYKKESPREIANRIAYYDF